MPCPLRVLLCLSAPHKVLSAEGDKQEFRLAEFDFIIFIERGRRVHRVAVEIHDPIGVAGQQHGFLFLGVKYDNRVVAAGDLIVAQDLNIHVVGAANEIFPLDDLIVLALARAVNADDPAADGLDVLPE